MVCRHLSCTTCDVTQVREGCRIGVGMMEGGQGRGLSARRLQDLTVLSSPPAKLETKKNLHK